MAEAALLKKHIYRSSTSREVRVLDFQQNKNPILLTRIVQDNAALIHSIAQKYKGEPYEDIVQTGYIGLLNAINRYQYRPGVKFTTYATCMIEGEIKHYLRDKVLIKEPRWSKMLNRCINDAVAVLRSRLGRMPTVAEISEEINVEEEGILEVLKIRTNLNLAYLDDCCCDKECSEICIDKIKSKRFETMQLPIEDKIVLEQAIDKLTDMQQKVIFYLFYKDLSQIEVANILGTTQRSISRILSRSLTTLKEALETEIF